MTRMQFDFTKLRRPQPGLVLPELDFKGELDFEHIGERLNQVYEQTERAQAALRAEYERRRRCTETRADGKPCKAWAVWDAAEQKCFKHLSPEARAAHEAANQDKPRKTPRPTCDCEAYPFPHRPGNGYCVAPQPPLQIHPLPAGKRRTGRMRRRDRERINKKLGLDNLDAALNLLKR